MDCFLTIKGRQDYSDEKSVELILFIKPLPVVMMGDFFPKVIFSDADETSMIDK